MIGATIPEIDSIETEDEREIQSVLIERHVGEEKAREQAEEIVETVGEG